MKNKISITLSSEVMESMAEYGTQHKNRSEFIENAVRDYVAQLAAAERDTQDRKILNKMAKRLNQEAEDVLDYQDLA